MTRYTSWDYEVVQALQQYWFAYNVNNLADFAVTSLNRIKGFLEEYVGIAKPTKHLVEAILQETNTWKFLWNWIDTGMNVCNLFLVHGTRFKDSIMHLIENGKLKKTAEY